MYRIFEQNGLNQFAEYLTNHHSNSKVRKADIFHILKIKKQQTFFLIEFIYIFDFVKLIQIQNESYTIELIPRERKITDYYAVEYFTEVVPQIIQEKYIEYVPIETVKERTEYQAIYKQQVVEQPQQYSEIQYVQQAIAPTIQYPQQQMLSTTTTYQPQYSQHYYQTFIPSIQQTVPVANPSPSFIIQPSIGTTAWQPVVPGSIKNLSKGQSGSIIPNTRGSFMQ